MAPFSTASGSPHALKHGDRIRFANTQTVMFLDKNEPKPKPDKSQNKPPIPSAFLEDLQKAMDKVYPGLTMYVRDVNLPDAFAAKYQSGMFLCEKSYVDASNRVMGMITTHRYAILSNHMLDLSSFEHGTNWGLHVAQKDSHFRVLGTHTYQGKTAIFLLHLPDDDSWKLFQNTEINLDKQLLATNISRFETKCLLPPVPELTTQAWLDRCTFPIGINDNGIIFPLE